MPKTSEISLISLVYIKTSHICILCYRLNLELLLIRRQTVKVVFPNLIPQRRYPVLDLSKTEYVEAKIIFVSLPRF